MSKIIRVVKPNGDDSRSLLTSSTRWSSELPLSPRECEIARLVASDLTNKEIARVLDISEWTVSTHLRRIFSKLRVHTKAGMVAYVLDKVAMAERRNIQEQPRLGTNKLIVDSFKVQRA